MNDKKIIIDAVFTWVDGNEPAHKLKMQNHLKDKNEINSKAVKMRFGQINEIEFSVKSIRKYAKFVRNIFIVTDNQIPEFLQTTNQFPNVFIVDHKTIFEGYEQYLPTFNSRSIETLLYRIPNLSEHFIYLNDDMMLINDTEPTDFFRNGFPVLRGKWNNNYSDKNGSALKTNQSKESLVHRKGKKNAAALIGFDVVFDIHHTPYPLRKSTFTNYFNKNKVVLEENIKFKFRDIKQFVPQVLANHLELKNNTCVQEKSIAIVYVQSYNLFKIFKKFMRASYDKKRLFMCLQSVDQCPKWKLVFIKKWLDKKYN